MSNKVKVVVNEEKISETPTVLVGKAEQADQLSPNPAHSGFTKQSFVDSLPDSGEANVIYVVAQKSGIDQAIVGYKNYKWDLEKKAYVRVFDNDPALKLLKGASGVEENVVNAPKKQVKVIDSDVIITGDLKVRGDIAGTQEERDIVNTVNAAISSNAINIPAAINNKAITPASVTTDNATFNGVVTAGEDSQIKLFEDIRDAQGNKRFVEGNIELLDSVPEGLTSTYGKWSLSGSHLLLVLCIQAVDETVINGDICKFELPTWISDKIVPITGSYLDLKVTTMFASNLTTQSLSVYLKKNADNTLSFDANSLTLTADRNGRIVFDLLIDNEPPTPSE